MSTSLFHKEIPTEPVILVVKNFVEELTINLLKILSMSKRKMMIFLTMLFVGIMSVKAQKIVELNPDFAQKAYESGVVEIDLGKLAERNGNSDAVRNYGKMMVEDH